MSGKPYPQFGIPLDPNHIKADLPLDVQYGVTPDNKYVPLAIDESGKLQIGGVTFSGSVTVSDVTIKGVDPLNSNISQDVSVVNWGINGYALRSSIFYQGNPLLINPDGSINVNLLTAAESIPVSIDHNLDSVAIYGTDGTSDQFLKTDSNGNLQVNVIGVNSSFSANVTSVLIGNSETSLLPVNADRKGFSIYNISGNLYIKLGIGISQTSFSYVLPSRGILELDNYCGVVTAFRQIGSGSVLITERI